MSANRIDQTFQKLKAAGETALIPFLTVGDPDITTSIEIIKEIEAAGAHIVELGVPYSDPLADGPVIQRASSRALVHKITILDCIQVAKEAREQGVQLPFILFTYYNPILQLGVERFFQLLADNDISGMIIPDLPVEEDAHVRELAVKANIHLIPLVAPTSQDRIERIVRNAGGFIYCVSSLGVTGVRSSFHEGIEQFINQVKQATSLPVAVGFGISTNEQFRMFSKLCDGVVVGSAIVRKIEEELSNLQSPTTRQAALLQIQDFVRQLKA
ncbi:tryptophan synthase subunit alpha [Paenibacillus selenitireducens]|jgi:tryptophan synthase alpha chain|uniref:Tryptophan synthase alpha chain n=1 Tax=Paenibacillus selenitireducens TaxID=1324314 RepID=A0A1T2XNK0_9BACL|nr:tryptophan synthase subunit alpha [Paenibacillus selenitireducens]OPA81454.1 tryptophan synthase subunit alpha [Paenibacillus selenitireducens]